MRKEGMGLLLGVSGGSEEPARFIVLEYGPSNLEPIVLIGKGLTFDSGGISIKPADRMDEMKFDMCGGADVLGIVQAAAELKLPCRLVALIPAAENLVSGRAVKPGDVLKSHSGNSVEITDTDGEGRLILADAISYARRHYRPKAIFDYATLTGGVVVALGDEVAGYLTNRQLFRSSLALSSAQTGEELWELPLIKSYEEQIKSGVADLKNVGERKFAPTIVAALFLEKFVKQTPWVHFDIAGVAWTTRNKPYLPAGATGFGVYLTVNLLRRHILDKAGK